MRNWDLACRLARDDSKHGFHGLGHEAWDPAFHTCEKGEKQSMGKV